MAVYQAHHQGARAVTAASGTTVNVTIPSVTMANSVALMYFRSTNSVESRIKREAWTCQLTSATNVQFTRHEASFAKDGTIEWLVIEWDSSVKVHRGSASPTTQTSAHNIGATINTGSSFPVFFARTDQNGYFANTVCRATLSSTQITFNFESTPGTDDCNIEWQVVEFDAADASVQTGVIALPTGTASNTATITSVDTGKTFVTMGGISTTNSTGGEHRNQAVLELTNATTVTATKTVIGSGTTLNVQYYAVEMLDGSTVTKGLTEIPDTATVPTAQPSFAALTNPTAINFSYLQNDRNKSGTDQFIGDNCATVVVNGTNDGVVIQRSATDGALDVAWYVVDWNAGGGGGTTITVPLIGAEATVSNPTVIYSQTVIASLFGAEGVVNNPTILFDQTVNVPLTGTEGTVYEPIIPAGAAVIVVDPTSGETSVLSPYISFEQFVTMTSEIPSSVAFFLAYINDGTGIVIPLSDRQTYNAMASYLTSQGYTGSVNDIIYEWLISEGISRGALNDMLAAYWKAKTSKVNINDQYQSYKNNL